jgi:biotin synthase
MTREETINWLLETDAQRLGELWRIANDVRRANVGDEVHLRGLVEISNHCVRRCAYCGINADNASVSRYRMTADEILEATRKAAELGYGTVVLQAGEDYGITSDWMCQVVRRIKTQTALAVTLSLGERPAGDLTAWREAGADRYLLRFETSNPDLYRRIHPDLRGRRSDRFAILKLLRRLGYEVGSGVMIGIPGQTYDDLADDIEAFRDFDLDMIGVGPYIPHPATALGRALDELKAPDGRQAPATELMTYKIVALTRIACPHANIPSTTALATLNRASGRELGLQRGANIIMPNLTPVKYRAMYEIYPAKACLYETADECGACVKSRIASVGRKVGAGRGDSRNHCGADARAGARAGREPGK